MEISKKEDYILITTNNNFKSFLSEFKEKHTDFEGENIIIHFLENLKLSEKEVLELSEFSEKHQQNNTSFIVVLKDINIDEIPEQLNIVLTLQEAKDILEMENIQRDLGF